MPCAADCTRAPLIRLTGAVHRITDRQAESGTADLVENLREQARLEQLIDGVKPPAPSDWPEAGDGRLSGDIENWTRGDTKTGPPWSFRCSTG